VGQHPTQCFEASALRVAPPDLGVVSGRFGDAQKDLAQANLRAPFRPVITTNSLPDAAGIIPPQQGDVKRNQARASPIMLG